MLKSDQEIMEERATFYERDIDTPWLVNGFRGTWNFSDHELIPDILQEFIMLHFGVANIRKVPLSKINALMNEVWEGPGSLRKIFNMVLELRKNSAAREIRFPMVGTKGRSVTADEDDDDDNLPDLPLSSFGLDSEEELEDPEETV